MFHNSKCAQCYRPCSALRHFHKAFWSEQKYRQLLSASEREGSVFPSARRKLSTSFDMISEDDEGCDHTYHQGRRRSNTVESDSTDAGTEYIPELDESDLTEETMSDIEPVRRSSDSVFAQNISAETFQRPPPFPGQPQAPPLDTTPPFRPKENPLTSKVNRARSQSAVSGRGRGQVLEQFTGTYPGQQLASVTRRSQSAAYAGGRKASLGVTGGPLSPLGSKGRTPSGKPASR